MSETKEPQKTYTHTTEIPADLNIHLKRLQIDLEEKGIKKKIPEILVTLAERAFKIHKLIESKEYADKEILNKVKHIMQDYPGKKE